MNWLSILITCIFLLIGGAWVVWRIYEILWLKRHGTRVEAKVREVRTQREMFQIQIGEEWETRWETYYYVVAEWRELQTGKVYIFKSRRLITRPWKLDTGSLTPIFFDPKNPGSYVMEIW